MCLLKLALGYCYLFELIQGVRDEQVEECIFLLENVN